MEQAKRMMVLVLRGVAVLALVVEFLMCYDADAVRRREAASMNK